MCRPGVLSPCGRETNNFVGIALLLAVDFESKRNLLRDARRAELDLESSCSI